MNMKKVNVDAGMYGYWEELVKRFGSQDEVIEMMKKACRLAPVLMKTFNSEATRKAEEEAKAKGETYTMVAFDFDSQQEKAMTEFLSHYKTENEGIESLINMYKLADLILASCALHLSWVKDEKQIELTPLQLHELMDARIGA